MSRFVLAATLLALPLAGCAVSAGALSSGDQAVNQCQRNEDCAQGVCIDQICAAQSGALSSVLVSVTPAFAGGTYYLDYPPAEGSPSSGDNPLDINVPPLVGLVGSIRIDTTPCEPVFIPVDGTSIGISHPDPNAREGLMPADVTFRPSARVAGLPADLYRGVVDANGYTFGANLPLGEYDIYIRPYKQPVDDQTGDTTCPVPPRLLQKQNVTGSLDFKLAPPSQLDVQVVWAKEASPSGWILDLIDPSTGYPISLPRVLRDSDFVSSATHDSTYQVTLAYVPTYGPDKSGVLQPLSIGTDVLRLRPPEPLSGQEPITAPTLLAQLTGAEVGNDASGAKPPVMRQSTLLPSPVSVVFGTEISEGHVPAPASVTITAQDLPGFSELFTSFTRVAVTDSTGLGQVDLLPGKYRVVATPKAGCDTPDPSACLGTTETSWEISPAPSQSGKMLGFLPAAVIQGRALVPSGAPAAGAVVRAIASPSIVDSNVMNQGDASSPTLARSTFGQVDSQGGFALGVDAGTYDFRIEPDPSTGFGWYVRPNVDTGVAVITDLDVRLPLPVVHRGSLTSGSSGSRTALPSALIRAYVYRLSDGSITDTPTKGAVAVQVAETHADDAGNFSLLLPSTLEDQ